MPTWIIECSNCHSQGVFPIEYTLTIGIDSCSKCNHVKPKVWTYYFCCNKCFAEWYAKNKDYVECKNCNGTGWDNGFQQNGMCKLCKGSKIIENGKAL